jgi:hypothetical protein
MRRLAPLIASLLLLTPAGAAQARGGVHLHSAVLEWTDAGAEHTAALR